MATGYHAIEFLLWGQDLNGTGPGAGDRPWTDYARGADCTGGNCDRRAAYLSAATDLLVADLREMAEASRVGARLHWKAVPVLAETWELAAQDCVPDGTRNNLSYLADFVTTHSHYDEAKLIDILRKTWQKMSARGREAALTMITLPPELVPVILKAVGPAT